MWNGKHLKRSSASPITTVSSTSTDSFGTAVGSVGIGGGRREIRCVSKAVDTGQGRDSRRHR